jgi:phosphate acetyltransferase
VFRGQSFGFWSCANPTAAEQLAEIAISSADSSLALVLNQKSPCFYSSGSSGKGDEVDKVRTATEIVRKT